MLWSSLHNSVSVLDDGQRNRASGGQPVNFSALLKMRSEGREMRSVLRRRSQRNVHSLQARDLLRELRQPGDPFKQKAVPGRVLWQCSPCRIPDRRGELPPSTIIDTSMNTAETGVIFRLHANNRLRTCERLPNIIRSSPESAQTAITWKLCRRRSTNGPCGRPRYRITGQNDPTLTSTSRL